MLRDDDQELSAKAIAGPDLRVAAIITPPLVPVTGRVRVGGRHVIHVPRCCLARPTGWKNSRAAPHAIVHVQLTDFREVERREIETALCVGMLSRRSLPME